MKKRIFPGESKPLTDRQRRARFDGIFIALTAPAAGFLCSDCMPLDTDISSDEVDVWQEGSHGWTGPVLCNVCHLSIPVYVDAQANKTPPEDSKGNLISVFREEDRNSAWEAYNRASELDGDPKTYEEAERLYREAVRLDPGLDVALTNLGNVLYRRNDPFGASECYQKAIQLNPKQVEAHYNLGCIWHDACNPKRAIPHFIEALAVAEAGDRIRADIHYNIAKALDEVGEVEEARRHWTVYLNLEPDGEWAAGARQWLKDTEHRARVRNAPDRPRLVAIRGGKS